MNSSERSSPFWMPCPPLITPNLMWNQEVGNRELPPDCNFHLKTCIEVASGLLRCCFCLRRAAKTWNVALQSFNPTTGLGGRIKATGAHDPGRTAQWAVRPFCAPKSATTLKRRDKPLQKKRI